MVLAQNGLEAATIEMAGFVLMPHMLLIKLQPQQNTYQ